MYCMKELCSSHRSSAIEDESGVSFLFNFLKLFSGSFVEF